MVTSDPRPLIRTQIIDVTRKSSFTTTTTTTTRALTLLGILSCLACVRPVYLCWGAIVSISNLTQLSWYFALFRFLYNFKCPPNNILPVTFINFPPFVMFSVLVVGFTLLFHLCQLSIYFLRVLLFWITASLIRTSIRSKYCVYFAFTYYACKWICYQPAHRPPQCVQFIQQCTRCFVTVKPVFTTHPPFRN